MVKEKREPAQGETYVETVLHVKVPSSQQPVYVYEKNTGVLVAMNLPKEGTTGKKPFDVDVRGLRAGNYNVAFNSKMIEVTIGKEKDVTITF